MAMKVLKESFKTYCALISMKFETMMYTIMLFPDMLLEHSPRFEKYQIRLKQANLDI